MSRIPSASPRSQCGFASNSRSRLGSSRMTTLSCSSFPGGTSAATSFGIQRAASSRSVVSGWSSVSIALMRSPSSRMRAFTASVGGPPLLALFRSACSCSFSLWSARTFRSRSTRRSSGASKWRAASIARTRSGSSRTRWRTVTVVPLSAVHMWNVVLVAFEGPDRYSFVGGLATRMTDLSEALVARGHRVRHLFVGDPRQPHVEIKDNGLVLERWGQWISAFHPKDVYDGEDGKYSDFSRTVPPHLADLASEAERRGERTVMLFEDWQTGAAAIGAATICRARGVHAPMFWNANNTYGFGRVDFPLL